MEGMEPRVQLAEVALLQVVNSKATVNKKYTPRTWPATLALPLPFRSSRCILCLYGVGLVRSFDLKLKTVSGVWQRRVEGHRSRRRGDVW